MTLSISQSTIDIWIKSYHGKNIMVFDTNMNIRQFNEFRRIILSEIAVVAIDLVQINSNSTIMVDEILANRIGQIPVATRQKDSIIRKDLCDCEAFCNKCSFVIEFKGKQVEKKTWLLSNDISPLLLADIPLVTIDPGQEISFNMLCTKSIAKEHSKYSPRITCSIKIDESKKGILRVILDKSGPLDYLNVLKQAFGILKVRLNVNIRIN